MSLLEKKNKFLIVVAASALIIGGLTLFTLQNQSVLSPEVPITDKALYKGLLGAEVSILAKDIPQATDIEITPDGKYMLVATLTGKVEVFQKVNGIYRRQKKPFFIVETAQPGFPPEEAGLTGIILGADFNKSGDVFFTYSYKAREKEFKNRVLRVTFTKIGRNVFGQTPRLIFEANTLGGPSHQIQDGVGIMVADTPHIFFTVGEGFKAERALDPNLEAGKAILIQADGETPLGERPFENPKIQIIGIRNAPDIALSHETGKFILSDTGPDNYDRLVFGKLVDENGNNIKRLSLNWNGTEESLRKVVADPYESGDMIIHRWKPTETPVALNFLSKNKILVTLFGQTGSKDALKGKEILLGEIIEGRQDRVVFKRIVELDKEGVGKLSHPIGTAVDPITNEIYFADLMDGKIYKVVLKGGE